jgi:hypothetical protein
VALSLLLMASSGVQGADAGVVMNELMFEHDEYRDDDVVAVSVIISS